MQRGKSRQEKLQNCKAARQIVTARLNRSEAATMDVDHMLLAGIDEQEAELRRDVALLQDARDALRPLVDRADSSEKYLSFYIQFLLRHLERGATLGPQRLVDGRRSGHTPR